MIGELRRAFGVTLGAVSLLMVVAGSHPTRAQTTQAETSARGWSPLVPALQETLKSGRSTVVVVTSRSEPVCAGFCRLLPEVMATQAVGNVVLLAEMSVEAYPERVKQLGVSRFPTILVYGRSGDQLALIDNRQGIADPYQATAWLDAMRQSAENQSKPDPQVQNTQYATSQTPTPQYEQPPQPAPPAYTPPPTYVPAQPQPQPVPVVPTYSAPAPQPIVVAPPMAPVLVAPPAQTIMVAPSPPPNIVFAAPSQPTIMMAPTAPAPTPPQLFMSAPPQPVQMAPQPVQMAPQPVQMAPVAMAPQPVQMAPPQYQMAPPQYQMAPPQYQMAPPQYQMAPVAMAPQQQVGQSPLGMAVLTTVLTNPGLIGRLLGTFGECLAELKQPRMRTGSAPIPQMQVMQAPVAAAPSPGYGMAPAIPPGYQLVPAYPAYAPEDYGHDHGFGKHCRLCGPRDSRYQPDYQQPPQYQYQQQPPQYQQPPQQPYNPGPSPSPQGGGSTRKNWFGH